MKTKSFHLEGKGFCSWYGYFPGKIAAASPPHFAWKGFCLKNEIFFRRLGI